MGTSFRGARPCAADTGCKRRRFGGDGVTGDGGDDFNGDNKGDIENSKVASERDQQHQQRLLAHFLNQKDISLLPASQTVQVLS